MTSLGGLAFLVKPAKEKSKTAVEGPVEQRARSKFIVPSAVKLIPNIDRMCKRISRRRDGGGVALLLRGLRYPLALAIEFDKRAQTKRFVHDAVENVIKVVHQADEYDHRCPSPCHRLAFIALEANRFGGRFLSTTKEGPERIGLFVQKDTSHSKLMVWLPHLWDGPDLLSCCRHSKARSRPAATRWSWRFQQRPVRWRGRPETCRSP